MFIVALRAIQVWQENHQHTLEMAKEIQMKGPQPFWMQRMPQSFEEMVEQMRRGLPETEDDPDGSA
jgi:hypothetical protein